MSVASISVLPHHVLEAHGVLNNLGLVFGTDARALKLSFNIVHYVHAILPIFNTVFSAVIVREKKRMT